MRTLDLSDGGEFSLLVDWCFPSADDDSISEDMVKNYLNYRNAASVTAAAAADPTDLPCLSFSFSFSSRAAAGH